MLPLCLSFFTVSPLGLGMREREREREREGEREREREEEREREREGWRELQRRKLRTHDSLVSFLQEQFAGEHPLPEIRDNREAHPPVSRISSSRARWTRTSLLYNCAPYPRYQNPCPDPLPRTYPHTLSPFCYTAFVPALSHINIFPLESSSSPSVHIRSTHGASNIAGVAEKSRIFR